jgi:hypothetical protein
MRPAWRIGEQDVAGWDACGRRLRLLGLLGAVLLSSSPLAAQDSTATSASASATIAGAIRITNTGDLAFGDVLPGASTGTVRVDVSIGRTPTVTRIAAGGAQLAGSVYSAATFYLQQTGSWWPWVRVTLPSGPVTLTRVGGGATMTVDSFETNCSGSGIFSCPTMPFTLYVGARLNVSANQMPGVYSGTFGVTAHQP